MFAKHKKAIITDYLGWIILGVAVLVLVVIGIMILTGKGHAALDYIKNLLRFGR